MLPSYVLKALELGLVSARQVVRWANEQIVAINKPEPWLIELATTRGDNHDLASSMRQHGASTEVEDEIFVALIAYGFFHSRITLEQARAALYNHLCLTDWKEMTPLRQEIYVLDDDMDRDTTRARRRCEAILDPFLETGERLMAPFTGEM